MRVIAVNQISLRFAQWIYAAAPMQYAKMSLVSVTEFFINIGRMYSKVKEQKT